MKHFLVVLLLLIQPLSLWANDSVAPDGAGFCIECSSGSGTQGATAQMLIDFESILKISNQSIAEINKKMNFGPTCSYFAHENGLGPWGRFLVKEMNRETHPYLYDGTPDLIKYCPNFPNLQTDEEKELVFMLILDSLGNFESTCNATAKGKGPNGRTFGLLQLHKGHEEDARAFPKCQNGDSRTAEGSIRCALSILNMQFYETDRLFSNDSHFAAFRTNLKKDKKHLKMKKALQNFELCTINNET